MIHLEVQSLSVTYQNITGQGMVQKLAKELIPLILLTTAETLVIRNVMTDFSRIKLQISTVCLRSQHQFCNCRMFFFFPISFALHINKAIQKALLT